VNVQALESILFWISVIEVIDFGEGRLEMRVGS